jgi:hypothetical protein
MIIRAARVPPVLVLTLSCRPVASFGTAAPLESSPLLDGLLIAGGSLETATTAGLVATHVASIRELGTSHQAEPARVTRWLAPPMVAALTSWTGAGWPISSAPSGSWLSSSSRL